MWNVDNKGNIYSKKGNVIYYVFFTKANIYLYPHALLI